jgi:hypothetical protein
VTALVVVASKTNYLNGTGVAARNNNYGDLNSMIVGGGATAFSCNSIFQFDLSGLDAGTIINSATLSFWTSSAGVLQQQRLVLMPAADVGWVEGTGNIPAAAGESCWNWHAYASVAWSGGVGAGGGTLIQAFDALGAQYAEKQIILDPALVQAWVGPAGVNPGLAIKYQGPPIGIRAYLAGVVGTGKPPTLTMDVTYPTPSAPSEPESASGLILEYSLDGVNYVDISGMACEVALAGGERGVGEAYRYPVDTAAVIASKRGPVDVTIRLLYQDETAFPCEVFRQAMEAEDRIWLRWSPLDHGGVGHLWYTTDPDCVIADFGYPDGEAGPGEPMMVALNTRAEHIITSVKTS